MGSWRYILSKGGSWRYIFLKKRVMKIWPQVFVEEYLKYGQRWWKKKVLLKVSKTREISPGVEGQNAKKQDRRDETNENRTREDISRLENGSHRGGASPYRLTVGVPPRVFKVGQKTVFWQTRHYDMGNSDSLISSVSEIPSSVRGGYHWLVHYIHIWCGTFHTSSHLTESNPSLIW
jgi:hypothetical protein